MSKWNEKFENGKAIVEKNGKTVEFACPESCQQGFFPALAENMKEFDGYKDCDDMCEKRGMDSGSGASFDAWRTECNWNNGLKKVLGKKDYNAFIEKHTSAQATA